MTKKLILIFLIFINLSCKNKENFDSKKTLNKENLSAKVSNSSETIAKKINKNELDCSQITTKLVKSSNVKNPFKDDLEIEITDNNGVNMKLRLFDANDKLKKTIGWIIFDAENMRLLDITNDIKNPVKLAFDHKLWNQIIECSFNNDKSYYIEENSEKLQKGNCKTTTKNMETIEECTFDNTNLNHIYNKIIIDNELKDSKYLSKVLPKANESITVNKKGVLGIDYKAYNSKNVEITINYEGGVTTILIEEINNNVKRVITYSAD